MGRHSDTILGSKRETAGFDDDKEAPDGWG